MFLGVSGLLQTSFHQFWMNPEAAKALGIYSPLPRHIPGCSPCILQGESHRISGFWVFFLLGSAGILLSLPSEEEPVEFSLPAELSSAQIPGGGGFLMRNSPKFPFPGRLWLRAVPICTKPGFWESQVWHQEIFQC